MASTISVTDRFATLATLPAKAYARPAVELTVVVPAFNERDNIDLLVGRLDDALGRTAWEVVYVDDDSPDGTAAAVRELSQIDPRVRCVQRIGRRGLSTAVIEGILASSAPYVAVMDADLQHDESALPTMLETLKRDKLDVVVGSRYTGGGGIGEWNKSRAAISKFATQLARVVVPADLTDPMSGFFVMTRAAFDQSVRQLSGQGFKILLDLFASSPTPYRFKEVPYTFRDRIRGESKLDGAVVWEYLMLLVDKTVGRWVPARFVLFTLVGTLGLLLHLAVLRTMLVALSFPVSQAVATVVAMVSNFSINNALTYRDRRLRGWKFVGGLLTFCAICGIGAIANVRLASAAFERHYDWWLSGLAGAAASVVWNYAVTSIVTWRK
ncbi:MAG TPA: glycosyltransferase family 2 protein [Vicinamibacterales bacterium]|nr:glycosyltransferase family 2 protein [Vicinamibacterales bacterium]